MRRFLLRFEYGVYDCKNVSIARVNRMSHQLGSNVLSEDDHGVLSGPLSGATPGQPRQRHVVASKLEVLRARQINRISKISLILCGISLAFSVGYLIWAWTAAFEPLYGVTTDGRKVKISSYKRSMIMTGVDSAAAFGQILVISVLTPVYFLRVFRNNKSSVTNDQAMVGCFLIMTLFSLNPVVYNVVRFLAIAAINLLLTHFRSLSTYCMTTCFMRITLKKKWRTVPLMAQP